MNILQNIVHTVKKTYTILFISIVLFIFTNIPIAIAQNTQELVQEQQTNNDENQYIVTASDFMNTVADHYGNIKDLQALLIITYNDKTDYCEIYIKPPTKMHIAYRQPQGQIINSDGEDFYVYIPTENIVLYQKRSQTQSSAGTFVTRTGLDILLKNYSVSYFNTPEYVPLENDKNIINRANTLFSRRTNIKERKIVKIRLRRKSSTQSFREIVLSIGIDNLIYRVEAVTFNNENIQFDFINIFMNEGIPDTVFKFEAPATAPVINNLFYKENETKKDVASNE